MTSKDAPQGLEAEIAAEVAKMAPDSSIGIPKEMLRRAEEERPSADQIAKNETSRSAILSSLMNGLWQAKRAAGDAEFYRADVALLDVMLQAAGHIQDRASSKARAA